MANKNLLYSDNISERMNPIIEKQLRTNKHSLSGCDIFPEGDVITYEMKLIKQRFEEVVLRCREAFDVDVIDNQEIMFQQMSLVNDAMSIESKHIKSLEKMAVDMVMKEFNIPEGVIDFRVSLNPEISFSENGPTIPKLSEEDFDDVEEITYVNNEVKKRRVVNALIQGASKKVNHMYYMVNDELNKMNTRLMPNYRKLMSLADYMYYIIPDMEKNIKGGMCEVNFKGDDESNGLPILNASAMVFPVLIHEVMKGCMEILSANGFPKNEKYVANVLGKADFISAEPWDMRFGPMLWERFMESIPDSELDNKSHIYYELCGLPYHEFNSAMKEIIAKTSKGKKIIKEISDKVNSEIKDDLFNESMGDSTFDINDLF